MEKEKLRQKIATLIAAIEDLNDSRHNPSYEFEKYARDLFEKLMDEITEGY